MRIIVLAHGLLGAGAGSVGRNLLQAFDAVGKEHEFLVTIPDLPAFRRIVSESDRIELLCKPRPKEFGRFRLIRRWLWERCLVSKAVRESGADIVLGLADRGFAGSPCPQAVYLHRPHMFYPEQTWRDFVPTRDRWLIRYHCRFLRKIIRKEKPLLIVQTEAARQHVTQTYNYDRIVISPNSISGETIKGSSTELPQALGPIADKRKLFCLTRYYAHKNLESLVNVFSDHADQLADVVVLVTLDEKMPPAAQLLDKIHRANLENSIINLGEVPQRQLGGYFANVDGMILPTLLESFSGTYGEAMAFGVPILTSDRDFARTICGPAAEYFDPLDTNSICRSIRRVLDERAWADELVEAGRKRLGEIRRSWNDIAEQMLTELAAFARESR